MSARLEAILDEVRDALIGGNLSAVPDLAEDLEAATAALGRLDRPAAERLRRKADRNERLLAAAARGVKAARKRLAEIGSAETLSTYNSRGGREVISALSALPPHRV